MALQVRVPADRYYGAQTARSLSNFPIGWAAAERMPRPLITALGTLKKAAAEVNQEFGLPEEIAEAIRAAADQVSPGTISLQTLHELLGVDR